MNLLCRLFGHKATRSNYVKARFYARDGMGIVHVDLLGRCGRCGAEHEVGKLHLPTSGYADLGGQESPDKKYRKATEFGGYLATAVERYLATVTIYEMSRMLIDDGEEVDLDEIHENLSEGRQAVESAVYEFKKRASRAQTVSPC